jgi:hypothetical protein
VREVLDRSTVGDNRVTPAGFSTAAAHDLVNHRWPDDDRDRTMGSSRSRSKNAAMASRLRVGTPRNRSARQKMTTYGFVYCSWKQNRTAPRRFPQ